MKFKNFLTGTSALIFAGITVFGISQIPVSTTRSNSFKSAPLITANDGKVHLTCTGNVESLIEMGAGSAATNTTPTNMTQFAAGKIFINQDNASTATGTPNSDSAPNANISTEITWRESASEKTLKASEKTLTKQIFGLNLQKAENISQHLNGIFSLSRNKAKENGVSATNAHRALAGDLRGLASNPCTWATNSAWFVGLKSNIGVTNQLRIINPSANPIVVQISALNSNGKAQVGANTNIAIAPGELKKISLDGILHSNEQIALNLKSSTGIFGASIQTSALSGLTPNGIDFLKPAALGNTLLIPGLFLPSQKNITENGNKPLVELGDEIKPDSLPDDPAAKKLEESAKLATKEKQHSQSALVESNFNAILRLVNPSNEKRKVSIYTIRENAGTELLPGGENIFLAPNSVFDLSLAGLKSGSYSLKIVADGEISAAAQTISGTASAGFDYAWLAAQNPFKAGGVALNFGKHQLIMSSITRDNSLSSSSSVNLPPATVTWTAYDVSGKILATKKLKIMAENSDNSKSPKDTQISHTDATISVSLPDNTSFVELNADSPIYAAVASSEKIGEIRFLDWAPFTAGINEVTKIALNLQN